ncbi:acyltransferase family protein [Sphingobacterium humi]|uniref:Acyltransferase family protein n=1 Tax=Sphingobacterium humi TaxID=1796905 RepID=A0A6N8L285_9SPHI|nr:acyltransferase family protein [Sphingobacterium humi]
MKYKPEIDGLRAIAILFVLIFHLYSNFLPAGFICVDFFFVISGCFVTSIFTKSIEQGGLSPALWSMCITGLTRAFHWL